MIGRQVLEFSLYFVCEKAHVKVPRVWLFFARTETDSMVLKGICFGEHIALHLSSGSLTALQIKQSLTGMLEHPQK